MNKNKFPWTPANIPPKDGTYLVTITWYDKSLQKSCAKVTKASYYLGDWHPLENDFGTVTAYGPLPDVYKNP